jgi:hypothetical protein
MCNMFICHLFKISYNRLQKGKEGMEMGATCAIRRLRTPDVFNLKKEEREMEATHVADRKATYLYVYVRSLYLYVNLVKCKRALPCLMIL